MDKSKYDKKSQLTAQNIVIWTVGILLMLTTLSTWLVSNLFAKYVINDTSENSATVAAGGAVVELWEHKANLNNGIYELDEATEVIGYTYNKVIPGVDIAKDPFVRLEISNAEVSYALYVQITESNPFPDTVTYDVTQDWEVFDEDKGIYKYKTVFDAATPYEGDIKILKDDTLYVSEHYVGKDEAGNDLEFSLTFSAWLKQVD